MHLMSILNQLVSYTPLLVKKTDTVQSKQINVNLVRKVLSSVDVDVKSGDSIYICPKIKLKIFPGQFVKLSFFSII